MKNQKGSLLIIALVGFMITVIAASAYYLGIQKSNHQEIVIKTGALENPDSDISVKVEAGDIVVTRNGQDKKITNWGYNSSPVLSPDKSKIAYLSKTEETLKNQQERKPGYVPSSANVWIINNDGSNPVKVTNHVDWVFRDNLVWLDDNRLLFTDGVSSVKVYNITDKTLDNVMGPDTPEAVCVDACGYESHLLSSPDKKYIVSLLATDIPDFDLSSSNAILNTQTLITEKMNQRFTDLNFNSAQFKGDSLFIEKSRYSSEPQVTYNINLKTGEVSSL